MIISLLIEIAGTMLDFRTKSRNPPRQELGVRGRLALPLLGRLFFSRPFDDCGVDAELLPLLPLLDAWRGWGAAEAQPACRASHFIQCRLGPSPC